MIADLLPLLAFVAVVVLGRNAFEAYVLDRARARIEEQELKRKTGS
jgi:hypothetical protein